MSGTISDCATPVVVGTKAETLAALRPNLRQSICLSAVSFTIEQWQADSDAVIATIWETLGRTGLLVVRSSSAAEDNEQTTNAGAFASILGVAPRPLQLGDAIARVIASYGPCDASNQVLVQPQLQDVAWSGVVFTRELHHGAPYYVVNIEPSGGTDAITSGSACDHVTHYLRRGTTVPNAPFYLRGVMAAVRELEQLTGLASLDIEFAIDSMGKIFIFQVRRLVGVKLRPLNDEDQMLLENVRATVEACTKRTPGLAGRRTMLSHMADWNPAELIGHHPKPLADSLFGLLVADEGWREGRSQLGYFDPLGRSLMVTLAGRPYVDVRASFNSLMPACIPLRLRECIIDEAIDFLQEHPHLHDKVEFDVATSCFTPALVRRDTRFRRAGLDVDDIAELHALLRDHTEGLIRGDFRSLTSLMNELEEMDLVRERLLSASDPGKLWKARFLLGNCRRQGLTPFAAIARLAFVGNALLQSFVELGTISTHRAEAFLRSFETVAGEMTGALTRMRRGELSLETLLERYGHLRPGTFDLTSPRYDEQPTLYFGEPVEADTAEQLAYARKASFSFTPNELAAMADALQRAEIHLEVQELLTFIHAGVVAREKGKFLLTKSLSDALRLLAEWGHERGLGRELLAQMRIEQLFELDGVASLPALESANEIGERAAVMRERECQVVLPELIAGSEDLDHVRFITSHPTFVTDQRIIAPKRLVTTESAGDEICGSVVLIESADPGYDWILGHKIGGLVTKYGGAASHMAIRCAEFALPAAIGVGSAFESLSKATTIDLDCANERVRPGS